MDYRLTIGYDSHADSPEEFTPFKVLSFNRRHNAFIGDKDPEDYDVLSVLSYSEHGSHIWSLGYGRDDFDYVAYAGIIVWNDNNSDELTKEWWANFTIEEQREMLETFIVNYTEWSNGECYYIDLDRLKTCDMGYDHEAGPIEYLVGGYVGHEQLMDGIRDVLPSDANEDNTVITGDAEDAFEWHRLPRVAV